MNPYELLDLPLPENDSGARTVRGYLKALLDALWRQGEGFGGKRPFGNSSWKHDLYVPMVRAGIVPGVIDEQHDYLDEFAPEARAQADELILAAIRAL